MRFLTFLPIFLLLNSSFLLAGNSADKTLSAAKVQKSPACTETQVSGFQSNIYQTADGKVNVILIDSDADPVRLQIYDSNSHKLFTEDVRENSVRHRFSMHELEPGNYTFTLSKNGECFTKTVTVK